MGLQNFTPDATTSIKGKMQFATNNESVASKAVQSNDDRLNGGISVANLGQSAMLGDGKNGVVTLKADGTTSATNISWDATLLRYYQTGDLELYSLTFEDTAFLEARGWRLWVYDNINASACTTSGGYIADGRSASGITAGAGHPPALVTGAVGCGGGNGNAGSTFNNSQVNGANNTTLAGVRIGGAAKQAAGDAASNTGTSTGANGANSTAWVLLTHGQRSRPILNGGIFYEGSLKSVGGDGGPSGAGRSDISPSSVSRGAGGGGAGAIFFSAKRGSFGAGFRISANGGNGSSASATQAACGGGGTGGDGGYIRCIIGTIESGTLYLQAKGGTGGNGATNTLGGATYRWGGGGGGGNGGYIEYFAGSGTVSTSVVGGTGGSYSYIGTGGTPLNGTNGSTGTSVAAPITS